MEKTELKPITTAGIIAIPGLIVLFLLVTITVCFVCYQSIVESDVEYLVAYSDENEKCGFLNQNGNIILKANYDYCTELGDKYGLVNNTSGNTYSFSLVNPYGSIDSTIKYNEDAFFVYEENSSDFIVYIDHNLYDSHLNKINDDNINIIDCSSSYCAYNTNDKKEYGVLNAELKKIFKNTLNSSFSSINYDVLYYNDYFKDKYVVFDIDDKTEVVNINTGSIVMKGNELRNYDGSNDTFNVAIDNGTDSHSPDYAYYYYYFYGDNYSVYESKIGSLSFNLDSEDGYYELVNVHNNTVLCYINLFTGEITNYEPTVEMPDDYKLTNIDEEQVGRYGYELNYVGDKVGLLKNGEVVLDAVYNEIYSFGVSFTKCIEKDKLNYMYGISYNNDGTYTFHLIDLNSKQDVMTYTSESASYVVPDLYPYVVIGDYNKYALLNIKTGNYIEASGMHNVRNNSIEILNYDDSDYTLNRVIYYTRDLHEITSFTY